jgi:hypothetical protein
MQGPLADNLGEAENVRWTTPDVFYIQKHPILQVASELVKQLKTILGNYFVKIVDNKSVD